MHRLEWLIINIEERLEKYGLTPESYELCIQEIRNKVNGIIDIDWAELVNKYSLPISADTLRKASSQEMFGSVVVSEYFSNKENDNAHKVYKNETTINKDGSITSDKLINITSDDLKSPQKLLASHGFDVDEWELVSARNNIWNVYSKQDGIQELYSSKIVVKPIINAIGSSRISEWFNNLDHKFVKYKPSKVNNIKGDKLLLIDIADLHLNLQATMFSTGNEYNCDIAEKLFFGVLNDVIFRTSCYDLHKIIFCIGGDMLNADNLSGTTTKGTPQDNDTLYYDASERLYAMVIKAIDYLSSIADVHVIYVPGNHDTLSGFCLAKYVDAWFKDSDRVAVDYSPMPRKYFVYGKTLFVFSHDGNVKDLPRLISDEARAVWSSIEQTEVFLQHLHSENVLLESDNIRIQRLPTISAKSMWSINKGYNSKRQCKSFIFDKQYGLLDVIYTPISIIK